MGGATKSPYNMFPRLRKLYEGGEKRCEIIADVSTLI
jgi:hypothetical protein